MLNNILPEDFRKKREAEGMLQTVFASFGYEETGMEDCKSAESLCACAEPNILPSRLCCTELCRGHYSAALICAETPQACVEPIAVSAEALIALGIEDFYIKMGSNSFAEALCEPFGEKEKMMKMIASKDKKGLENIPGMSACKFKNIILNLHDIIGDADAVYDLDVNLPSKADKALKKLRDMYMLLVYYGLEKFPVLDLGLTAEEKYTDLYFEIYVSGAKEPICKGGVIRCGENDNAVAEFDLNMLAELCGKADDRISKTIIYPEKNACGIAYDLAYNLRVNGCIAEGYVGDKSYRHAERYAKNAGADCIMRVFADGRLLIKEFENDSITETTADSFLGYDEDEDICDCGHHHDDCDCGHEHH